MGHPERGGVKLAEFGHDIALKSDALLGAVGTAADSTRAVIIGRPHRHSGSWASYIHLDACVMVDCPVTRVKSA